MPVKICSSSHGGQKRVFLSLIGDGQRGALRLINKALWHSLNETRPGCHTADIIKNSLMIPRIRFVLACVRLAWWKKKEKEKKEKHPKFVGLSTGLLLRFGLIWDCAKARPITPARML